MKTLIKDNKELNYKVIFTSNKHSYLKPKNGFLEIHLSKRMSLKGVLGKIESNFDDYYFKTTSNDDNYFMLWGKRYQVSLNNDHFSYRLDDSKIIINTTEDFDYKAEIYKQELKKYINKIKDEVIQTLSNNNLIWVDIKYKKLKSKYGSYQTKKHYITLNTLLAALDKEYAYYVLMHEYAHQKVFNHQKPFYELLAKLYPNYPIVEKKLRKLIIHF